MKTRQQKRNAGAVDLRKEAQHHNCTVWLGGCNTTPTCLAHFRLMGVSGAGIKAPDCCAVIACHTCHEQLDRRAGHLTEEQIHAAFGRGLNRTLKIWHDKGILQW